MTGIFAQFEFTTGTRIGESWMLMDGIVKYRRIAFKNVLGSISMMNVKIDNTNPLDFPLFLDIAGGNRNVVKIAKPHGLVDFRMVTGWPHSTKGIIQLALHYQSDRLQDTADRQ